MIEKGRRRLWFITDGYPRGNGSNYVGVAHWRDFGLLHRISD
ncbi:hypothetical protein ES703_44217 [subsurface metagenome]